MIPKKLKKGSHVRVISPSKSLKIIAQENRWIANNTLSKLGLSVSFSKNAEEETDFGSSSIESRIIDLHEAFKDKKVNGVLTAIGGFNANQLLPYIDYKLIKKNPKFFCGYSDITALNNAIYAKTGLVNYSGPQYGTFGMKHGNAYTIDYFKKCVFEKDSFEIKPSIEWSDDPWYKDQENRTYIPNEGMEIIHEGCAKGTLVGGNLDTFALLLGTKYLPSLKNSILFVEDDYLFGKHFDLMFDRHLTSILQQEGANKIRGILIGRPQKIIEFGKDKIQKIINSKRELNNIPVISGVDIGHTTPMITLPIGGTASMSALKNQVKIEILKH
ncbi:MAG: S66 peptidase family protein [archaeon]|jgi:muramoyltetrapeptide carboxypeptidase LdcA involved in peptidoglycan recycling